MALSAAPSPVYLPAADVAERLFRVDMWDVPRGILNAVFSPRSRVAVKACHASSKSHTAALAIALALYEGGDVLTTAPTWEQVRTVLWGELHRLLRGSVIPLSEWGDVNQTEIVMPDGSHALGLSTNEGVRFQGWHARDRSFLLFVGDEAPGIRPDIYEAVEGISAGGDVRQLLLGNPVVSSGPFYDLYADESPGWQRFTIDAFDTPNLSGVQLDALLAMGADALDVSVRPYLVTRRWVYDRYHEWGADHPSWQSRVRGQFPKQGENALISLAWIEDASKRTAAYKPAGGPLTAGIDVAGPGEDETVLCVRQGDMILDLRSFTQPDPRGEVLDALRHWRHRGLTGVAVDTAGIGHYFARHLADVGLRVRDVNVGEHPTTADARERYANLKAELYWSLRERFRSGTIGGLTDRRAASQLAAILYKHDARGRIVIESKDDLRKRRGEASGAWRSPDRAEAIMLCFAPDAHPDLAALYRQSTPMRVR